ncbi:MAG: DUF2007-related protein [Bacteroidales bacterium]|jgi:hypothetical protein
MDTNKDIIIEVFSGTLWESEMVKSLLQDAEIESFLQNSNLNTYIYEPIQASGVKVMILSSDYEKAREIVDNYFRNMNNDSSTEEL